MIDFIPSKTQKEFLLLLLQDDCNSPRQAAYWLNRFLKRYNVSLAKDVKAQQAIAIRVISRLTRQAIDNFGASGVAIIEILYMIEELKKRHQLFLCECNKFDLEVSQYHDCTRLADKEYQATLDSLIDHSILLTEELKQFIKNDFISQETVRFQKQQYVALFTAFVAFIVGVLNSPNSPGRLIIITTIVCTGVLFVLCVFIFCEPDGMTLRYIWRKIIRKVIRKEPEVEYKQELASIEKRLSNGHEDDVE